MIAFIDDQRGVHGVEPICKVLPIAPSTYFDNQAKRADPDLLSDRAKRDALLLPEIRRVHKEHFEVYGAQKVWRQLGREGFSVARCTVERLMRANGIEGAVRGKPLRTTFSDKAAPCPKDHVNREFQASAPNRLWVSDFNMFVWSHFPNRQACRLARKCSVSRPGLALSMSPSSLMPFPAGSSAGASAARRIRGSCLMRWSRLCMTGGPCIAAA